MVPENVDIETFEEVSHVLKRTHLVGYFTDEEEATIMEQTVVHVSG